MSTRMLAGTALTAFVVSGCALIDAMTGSSEDEPDAGPTIGCETLPLTVTQLPDSWQVSGETSGDSLNQTLESSACGAVNGPEAVYYFDLDRRADLLWVLEPDFVGGVALIRRDCDGLDGGAGIPDDTCVSWGQYAQGRVEAAEPGRYYLFVEGTGPDDQGWYEAHLEVVWVVGMGESCDDGQTRCDSGLRCENGFCAGEDCRNLEDDDGDTLVDCADLDCEDSKDCLPGPGPLGTPCGQSNECRADRSDPICMPLPDGDGFCSEFCEGTCPWPGQCVPQPIGSVCLRSCADSGLCPAGFACLADAAQQVCVPSCERVPCNGDICNLDLGLCTPQFEDCGNSADDDGDGRIDCEDWDCALDPTCMNRVDDDCASAREVDAAAINQGDNGPGMNVLAGRCVGAGLPEEVWTMTAPPDGMTLLQIWVTSMSGDHGFYVRKDCRVPRTELACANDVDGAPEHRDIVLDGGETVYLVVDSPSFAGVGPYELRVTPMTLMDFSDAEPNDRFAQAQGIGPGQTTARIWPAGDQDYYRLVFDAPVSLTVRVTDTGDDDCSLGLIDPELSLYRADGTEIAFSDDGHGTCPLLQANVDAGTAYLRVGQSPRARPSTFVYGLVIETGPP